MVAKGFWGTFKTVFPWWIMVFVILAFLPLYIVTELFMKMGFFEFLGFIFLEALMTGIVAGPLFSFIARSHSVSLSVTDWDSLKADAERILTSRHYRLSRIDDSSLIYEPKMRIRFLQIPLDLDVVIQRDGRMATITGPWGPVKRMEVLQRDNPILPKDEGRISVTLKI